MNDRIRGPVLYDSLDRPNAPNPYYMKPPEKRGLDWRNTLIITSALMITCFALFFFLYRQLLYLAASSNTSSVYFATILLAIVYIAPVVLIAGAVYLILRYAHIQTRRATLVNTMDHQTTIDAIEQRIEHVMDRYMEVMLKSAEKSKFRGIQTLTYDESDRSQTAPIIAAKEVVQDTIKHLIPTNLKELKSRGLINRSGDSILLGYKHNTTEPLYLAWETFGVFGIAGKTNSGKTSTTRFILSQLALDNVHLIICDAHGYMLRDNLLSSITPLKPALIYPLCVTPDEIFRAIQLVYDIVRRRLDNTESSDQKIALIIDEFTSVMLRLAPTQLKEVEKLLLLLANEGRKTNVRVFILAQNWSADYVGNASIRSSMGGAVLHKMDERETKFFYQSAPAQLKKEIAQLKQGEAYVMGNNDPVKIQIPYISLDDLTTLEIKSASPSYAGYDEIVKNMDETALESDEWLENLLDEFDRMTNSVHIKYSFNTQEELISIMSDFILRGISKKQTLYTLLKTKPGGTKKYQAASKLYDNLRKKLEETSEEKDS